mgnify:CR=1 FL=1
MKRNNVYRLLFIVYALLPLLTTGMAKAETLTLQQCIAMARQNNRTLRNAAIDIQSANEQSKEAYTRYFPQISANVTAFRAFDKMVKGDGTYPAELAALAQINPAFADMASLAGQPYSFAELNRGYGATLSAMQPLYVGGQVHTANKLAKVQEEVSRLQHSLTEKDVVQKVTENYWQIAKVKYNLRTIEAAWKQMDAVYHDVENFVTAGVTTRSALLKVKMRQQELASNRLKLENADHILRLLLAQQIGAEEEVDIDVNENETLRYENENETLRYENENVIGRTAGATLARQELALAQKNVEAHQLQVKMARGRLMPTLAVGVMGYHTGFGGLSEAVTRNMKTTMTNCLALATLSIPISDWWGGTHAVRRARLKAQQAQNDYLDAQEKLAIDTETAWSNLAEAYQQIDLARATGDEAAENLRMSLAHYKAGTETLSDLLDAETLNRQAQDSLAAAIATYHIRLADYQRKTGK